MPRLSILQASTISSWPVTAAFLFRADPVALLVFPCLSISLVTLCRAASALYAPPLDHLVQDPFLLISTCSAALFITSSFYFFYPTTTRPFLFSHASFLFLTTPDISGFVLAPPSFRSIPNLSTPLTANDTAATTAPIPFPFEPAWLPLLTLSATAKHAICSSAPTPLLLLLPALAFRILLRTCNDARITPCHHSHAYPLI